MTTKRESTQEQILRLRYAYETALGDIDRRFPDEIVEADYAGSTNEFSPYSYKAIGPVEGPQDWDFVHEVVDCFVLRSELERAQEWARLWKHRAKHYRRAFHNSKITHVMPYMITSAPDWKLVADDPPPVNTDVLVGSTLYRAEARYIPAFKTWYRPTGVVLSFEPTHWQPWPELPR